MADIRTPAFSKAGTFFKVDDALGMAFGWAIVCTEGGEPYFDLQGDHIPEAAMASALADFAKGARAGKDQHAGESVGEHLFLYPVTTETAAGLGLQTTKTGAIVGWKPSDPRYLDMIKRGERTGFSIGGVLIEADVTDVGKGLIAKDYGGPPKDPKRRRRVFRTFKIHEISQVDLPAQEGATIGFVKRLLGASLEKTVVLTEVESGHQHVVCLEDLAADREYMSTSYDYAEGAEDGHTHRIVIDPQGRPMLSMNAGHTHKLRTPRGWSARVPDPPAPADAGVQSTPIALSANQSPDLTANPDRGSVMAKMTQPEIDVLNAELAKARRYGELTDAQKVYYARLAPADQATFLGKSGTERQAEIDGAVVHKAADGTLYFRTDDQRLVQLVKDNDRLLAALSGSADVQKRAAAETFAKATIPSFAGDDATRAALGAAVLGIADPALQKSVTEALAGANAALAMLAKSRGHNRIETGANPSAEAALYKGRDDFAKAANLPLASEGDRAAALARYTKTPEGAAHYRAFLAAQSTPAN